MKRIIKIVSISLLIGVVCFLLVAANRMTEEQTVLPPIINLKVQDGISILNSEELLSEIYASGLFFKGMKKKELDIGKIEYFVDHLNEVEKSEVYLGLDNHWYINVLTKRPVARVIANGIDQFYIDNQFKLMRLSPYAKPPILSFTGMQELIHSKKDYNSLINNDSLKTKLKLDQIYRISMYVCKDTFYNAQIEQVYYTDSTGFVLVPRVGEQKIIFGDAISDNMVKKKFKKLSIFYKDVIPFEGWEKYKTINLEFNDQIVATKN